MASENSKFKQGAQALVARLILERQPWSIGLAAGEEYAVPYGGAAGVVAEAIGGLAGWIGSDVFCPSLRQAASELNAQSGGCALADFGDAPEWSEILFMLAAADSVRDAVRDARFELPGMQENPKKEYAFCTARLSDCAKLGSARKSQGLAWSEELARECVEALIDAFDQSLSRPQVDANMVSNAAPEFVASLLLVEEARPKLLSLIEKWAPIMSFPRGKHRFGCIGYEAQEVGEETFELGVVKWTWSGSTASGRASSCFPWGFWLSWCAPSLCKPWGEALGVDWQADLELAREVSGFAYDADEWNEKEIRQSRATFARIERAVMDAMPTGSSFARGSRSL